MPIEQIKPIRYTDGYESAEKEDDEIVLPSLSELRKKTMDKEKTIEDSHKQIHTAIKSAALPRKSSERYDKQFGKKNERRAYKWAIALFCIAIVITFFAQPSIVFTTSGSALLLKNYSGREITNVTVFTSDDLLSSQKTPYAVFDSIKPFEEKEIKSDKVRMLIALSDRQLPAVGVAPISDQNINNDKNSNTPASLNDIYNQVKGGQ